MVCCVGSIWYEVLAKYAGDLGDPLGIGEVPLVKVFGIEMCWSCRLAHSEVNCQNNRCCQPISVWESISVCSVSEKEESEKLSHLLELRMDLKV